jgi:hypothetical protein
VCYVYENKKDALAHAKESTVCILEALDLHERDIFARHEKSERHFKPRSHTMGRYSECVVGLSV